MDNLELKDHLKQLERKLIFISVVGLLILMTLSLVSNFILKNEAAHQATSMIKRTVARDFREVVYTLNDAELNYFSAVIYFNQDGERLFSLPAELDLQTINQPNVWSRLANSRIETSLYFDPEKRIRLARSSMFSTASRMCRGPLRSGFCLFWEPSQSSSEQPSNEAEECYQNTEKSCRARATLSVTGQ